MELPSVDLLHKTFIDEGWTVRRRSTGRLTQKPSRKYLLARVGKRMLLVHRILFAMRTGLWPVMIDHIDGNVMNNNPDNLRPADKHTNQYNTGIGVRNTTGYKNVFWDRGAWRVIVRANGKPHNGGRFKDLDAAVARAADLRKQLHAEFSNGGVS